MNCTVGKVPQVRLNRERRQGMNKRAYARYTVSFILLGVLLAILFLWNINSGSVDLSAKEILHILFQKGTDDTSYNIVWQIRLPRILAAVILGGALSVSGFLLQTFFGNPIAGPYVLGISSGSKLVVSLVMVFLLGRSIIISSAGMIIAAFVGAMISMGFVLLVSRNVERMSMLVVSGVMS